MFELLLSGLKLLVSCVTLYCQFLFIYLAIRHPSTLDLIPKSYRLTVIVGIALFVVGGIVVGLAQLGGAL